VNGLFCPESVVVVGVSESADNLGRNVVANLVNLKYPGKIYAVGPRGGEVFGVPVYSSVSQLPENAELAVILTPARFVHEMLAQCGEKGTRYAVIESAGFRERGSEGKILEKEIRETSKKFGIRFVGPNCVGIVNTSCNLYAPFVAYGEPYRRGKISVFAQSGGVALCMGQRLCTSGMGVGKLVSMGNKLDLDEADYLAYLMDDPETDVIYFYLEGFKRGRAFADLARRCSKPIILHKSNNSTVSSTIAQSHTAALAADDQVVDSVCREIGILRVHSVTDAIIAAKGLSLPPLKGKNLAILSRSGGHAVVAADACASHGFHLPALGRDILDETQRHTRADVIRLGNPLDLGDIFDLAFYAKVMGMILRQDDIDGAVFIHVSNMAIEREATRHLLQNLSAMASQYGKPVALVVEIPFEQRVRLEKESESPFFLDPVEALQALATRWTAGSRAGETVDRIKQETKEVTIPVKDIEKWFDDIARQNRQPLLHEALDLLDLTGIPTVPWRMTGNLDEAVQASFKMGLPVALKAVSPSLLHKSDRGAISLNIDDAESLRTEWNRLQKVSDDLSGILVQKMAPTSRELVVGGKRDPSFGPVVLTGLGGIMVEVMKDVSMRVAPIGTDTAMKMFAELSGKRILGRFRGMREADLKAAARILVQVSLLMHHFPQIREMDLNPVSLNDDGNGAVALDARVLIEAAR